MSAVVLSLIIRYDYACFEGEIFNKSSRSERKAFLLFFIQCRRFCAPGTENISPAHPLNDIPVLFLFPVKAVGLSYLN